MKLGMAWYKKDQWNDWLKVRSDRNKIEKTYEEWEQMASDKILELLSNGTQVQKIVVDLHEVVKWCEFKNINIDATSISQFVTEILHATDHKALKH